MAPTTSPPGPGSTLPGLIAANVLSPEAAALAWLLVGAGIPALVTGQVGAPVRGRVLVALGQVRPGAPPWPEPLDGGDETLEPGMAVRRYLLQARDGRTCGATMEAPDLEAVLARLEGAPFRLSRDELGHLGLVLVLAVRAPDEAESDREEAPPRLVAAHWLRPVTRDGHGHAQRFAPVVLGTWDERAGRWEDFSWGVMPELGARQGRRAGELEADVAARARYLAGLAAAGVVEDTAVATALAGYAMGGGAAATDGPGPAPDLP